MYNVLDANGFKRKTYDELLEDISTKAKEYFGANANVSSRAALGIFIRIMAWFLSLAYQAIEAVYHSGFRSSAEGVQLDKLLPLAGTQRLQAEYATVPVTLTGTPNYTEPAGFIVGTENDVNFETLEDCTLDENGVGTVEAVCTQIGSVGMVAANRITIIVNPSADITSVTNLVSSSGGRDKETDLEARERSDVTVEGQGSGTTAAVRAELLKISDVRAAFVIENDTMATDIYNTPGKALQAFVLGGSDEDVAQAILRKKAGGIQAYGTTIITAKDIGGHPHPVGFTRAVEKRVYAKITLTTDVTFTATGEDDVKNALVGYVGGERTNSSITGGLSMGEDVIYAKALAHIMKITGVVDADLTLSLNGTTYNTNNISIAISEVAQLDAVDIEVTYRV